MEHTGDPNEQPDAAKGAPVAADGCRCVPEVSPSALHLQPAGGPSPFTIEEPSPRVPKTRPLLRLAVHLAKASVALAGIAVAVYYGWQSLTYTKLQARYEFRQGCHDDWVSLNEGLVIICRWLTERRQPTGH